MQCVDPAHHPQIRSRYRARLLVDRRTRQLEDLRLLNDWQGLGSVDHSFALNNPALMSAHSKNHSLAPGVRCSRGEPEIRLVGRRLGTAKHILGPRQQLLIPFDDLGGTAAKLLGQFGQSRAGGHSSSLLKVMITHSNRICRTADRLDAWFAL